MITDPIYLDSYIKKKLYSHNRGVGQRKTQGRMRLPGQRGLRRSQTFRYHDLTFLMTIIMGK